ncbi:primosomal protein [Demequina sp. B12]|uniref:primosomal protein n=1 Tax=Demequina sp. B12 TaxID=2992757 RepID=UPI00237ADBF6|nr:primosomal protein [Demequina sp. B12]MDE0573209.1 primosomal protein [Demequina sp. B12]
MSVDAREALRRLTAALETHLEAIAERRGDEDAAVDNAYEVVASAFATYEDALDREYAETLPIVLADDFDSDVLDGHAVEDEDALDDDLDDFDLQ